MALNSASTPNSTNNNNSKKRGKSSNSNRQSTAQRENSHQPIPQRKDKNSQPLPLSPTIRTNPPAAASSARWTPPPPAPSPSSWQLHVPLPGFNADEIKSLLNSTEVDGATLYRSAQPALAQKQGPWGAKLGSMANGKDFWVELRRQIAYIQRDGGAPKGG